MNKMKNLKQRLSVVLETEGNRDYKLQKICSLLDKEIEHFNWTGFYFKDKNKDELVLGPFVGAETDHVRIPYGKGICGQVAVSGKTLLVPDVSEEENYLACSISTRSELVVPIFKNGENIGQIDIDSHLANAFTNEDKELLEWLCGEIGEKM